MGQGSGSLYLQLICKGTLPLSAGTVCNSEGDIQILNALELSQTRSPIGDLGHLEALTHRDVPEITVFEGRTMRLGAVMTPASVEGGRRTV